MKSSTSGYAIFGAVAIVLLAILLAPVVVFLSVFIGIKIVLAMLAGHYWTAFWWCWLYGLFPIANGVAKAGSKD